MANKRENDCPHSCVDGIIQSEGPGPDESRAYPCPHCDPQACLQDIVRDELRRLRAEKEAVAQVLRGLRDKYIDATTACYRVSRVLGLEADHDAPGFVESFEDDDEPRCKMCGDSGGFTTFNADREPVAMPCPCKDAPPPHDAVIALPAFEDLRAADYVYLLKLGADPVVDLVSHFAVVARSLRGKPGLRVECTHGGWEGRLWPDPKRGLMLTVHPPSGMTDIRIGNATPTEDQKLNRRNVAAWLTSVANNRQGVGE